MNSSGEQSGSGDQIKRGLRALPRLRTVLASSGLLAFLATGASAATGVLGRGHSASLLERSSITLHIVGSGEPIAPGAAVTVEGALSLHDSAAALDLPANLQGVKLLIMHRINPEAHFTQISTTETAAGGGFSFTPTSFEGPIKTNRHWFVEALNGKGKLVGRSGEVKLRVLAPLVVNPAPSSTVAGSVVTITGSVQAADAGAHVNLARLIGAHWEVLGDSTVGSDGSFSIAHLFKLPSSGGPSQLRVTFAGSAENVRTTSPTFNLQVERNHAHRGGSHHAHTFVHSAGGEAQRELREEERKRRLEAREERRRKQHEAAEERRRKQHEAAEERRRKQHEAAEERRRKQHEAAEERKRHHAEARQQAAERRRERREAKHGAH